MAVTHDREKWGDLTTDSTECTEKCERMTTENGIARREFATEKYGRYVRYRGTEITESDKIKR
jgi:hypothetical protein